MNKTIPGIPAWYEATPKGFIYSTRCKKPRTLRGFLNDGYVCVILQVPGPRRNFRMHRLIASAFIPNSENKPFVNHINGNKSDNRPKNLEWCTHSENMKHAWATGLSVKTTAIEAALKLGRV